MRTRPVLLQAGALIGDRYEVRAVLGRGGFGVVYRVVARHDGEEYALKTYLRDPGDRRALDRFRQEAEIWIALGAHPNIVQAHFVDEIDGRLYVGMEMIRPGPSGLNSLDAYLSRRPPDLARSLWWAIQLCHGMEHAVSAGVRSHRDLKPANIMISPDETVQISDFGLASFAGTAFMAPTDLRDSGGMKVFQGQTVRGIGFGTPTHMAPEQFDDAAGADERSDIYSTGVILHQMATGLLPVVLPRPEDGTLESRMRYWSAMADAHRTHEFTDFAHPLAPVIQRAMAVNPAARYPSFAELRSELDRLLFFRTREHVPVPTAPRVAPTAWLNRGLSLQRLERYAEALSAYECALESDGALVGAWIGKGICLSRLDRFAEAIEAFDSALACDPGNVKALANKGNCLGAIGDPKGALEALNEAIAGDGTLSGAWSSRGNVLAQLGRVEEALASYERAVALEPGLPGAQSNRGLLLMSLDRSAEALDAFDAALAMNDRFAPAIRGKAECLVRHGDYASATELYDRPASAGAMTPEAWLGLGLARLCCDAHAEALRCFQRAAESPPVRGRALAAAASAHFAIGRFERAHVLLSEAAEWGLHDPGTQRLLALILHASARYEEAIQVGRRLLDRDMQDAASAANLACSLLHTRRDADALDVLDRAVDGAARDPARDVDGLVYNRGVANFLLGRVAEALADFTAAIDHEPYWVDAWHNRGACEYALGDSASALRSFNAAVQYERRHMAYWSREVPPPVDRPTRRPDTFHASDATVTVSRLKETADPLVRAPMLRPAVTQVPRYLPFSSMR